MSPHNRQSPDRSLSVALLSYRGNPLSGGQGVYVRHLSRELCALGVDVEVIAGPPYPRIDAPDTTAGAHPTAAGDRPGLRLTRLPSLDLYREPDPFRLPNLREFRSPIDVLEFALMCTAGFPEPLTFSLRVARLFAHRRRAGLRLPDVVHDNQGLGYGLLALQRGGLPVIATVHHAITVDRRLELAAAPTRRRRLTLRRWYGFVRMQRRVLSRLPAVISVSATSARGVEEAFGLPAGRVRTVPIGVDAVRFAPAAQQSPPDRPPPDRLGGHAQAVGAAGAGRLIVVSSAEAPLKGLVPLLEAVAKLLVERDVELVVVGRRGPVAGAAVDRLGIAGAVSFVADVSTDRLVELFNSAHVAVVPSLYEGFSLPAVEAMSCGLPVVATTGGALPEVVGPDGTAGLLVPPGDAGALAVAIGRLLDDPLLRAGLGSAGRRRVLERFTWRRTAERTVDEYRMLLDGRSRAGADGPGRAPAPQERAC